jgi:endonuclease/exonuclease/phosphatase (EEP) superfamily protein YafD
MVTRFNIRYLLSAVSAIVILSLISCVSVSDQEQSLTKHTHASAVSGELKSCDKTPDMQQLAAGEQAIDPENIAFLNWNIYKGNGENWQQDLEVFASTHQVMTIQEAMLSEELTALLDLHDFNWVMNTAFHLNGSAAGVMNVANIDAVHSCGFKVKEPLIRIPKAALVSYYNIQGAEEKLLVANIHGINFTLGMDSYRQQLNALYDSIRHHQGPMIVAGDFNSWSDERMSEVLKLVDSLSLAVLDYPVNNKTHFFGKAIDHVFYRQLNPVSYDVRQVTSSDHNPISVNFRYTLPI